MLNKLKNSQGIHCITMEPVAQTMCVLGGDWYSNQLTILFYPGDYYPDYTEVQEWIMESIDGKELNIEDVVNKVYLELKKLEPRQLRVIDRVRNCKTHFDVTVEK